MIDALVCLLGLALVQLLGAGARRLTGTKGALLSVSSAWVGISILYAASLGLPGLVILAALIIAGVLLRQEDTVSRPGLLMLVIAVVVLARPWAPTYWDEFVWLAKARLESLGFGSGVRAALDPAQKVIPQGYPTLWPSAVGWLGLGRDALHAHVIAATMLVLLSVGSAIEAWRPRIKPALLPFLAVLAAPLVWVHLRATYLDLPVGLLGLALLGFLLEKRLVVAVAIAVVLVGIKDDGLAQVLAASAAAIFAARRQLSWKLGVPAAVALIAVGVWRVLAQQHGVAAVDHALTTFEAGWIPRLVQLFLMHATDVTAWGVFWAVALAVLVLPRTPAPLRVMILLELGLLCAALLTGPERVRVFAENGTLLNRLLLQLWPAAAAMVLLAADASVSREGVTGLRSPFVPTSPAG